MSERVTLAVEDGVGEMLTALAGGERKRGEYLSRVVRALYAGELEQRDVTRIERVEFAFAGFVAEHRQLEGRVRRMEREVAALIAQRAEAGAQRVHANGGADARGGERR